MANVRSMTGFGRAEATGDGLKITAELKSVNHRYLDISVRIPRSLSSYEAGVRDLLKQYLKRGKADIYIACRDEKECENELRYDENLAAGYAELIRDLSERFGLKGELSAYELMRLPDVVIKEERVYEGEEVGRLIADAVREAAEKLVSEREREGENLRLDILAKLDRMEEDVKRIEEISPGIVERYRERLYQKISEVLAQMSIDIDDVRIVTETAIYADKVSTDEETVRLRSHIDKARTMLIHGGSVGRELDFLLQEMTRETNTTLSKTSDLFKSDIALSLKTTIEKIREQVQNLE